MEEQIDERTWEEIGEDIANAVVIQARQYTATRYSPLGDNFDPAVQDLIAQVTARLVIALKGMPSFEDKERQSD